MPAPGGSVASSAAKSALTHCRIWISSVMLAPLPSVFPEPTEGHTPACHYPAKAFRCGVRLTPTTAQKMCACQEAQLLCTPQQLRRVKMSQMVWDIPCELLVAKMVMARAIRRTVATAINKAAFSEVIPERSVERWRELSSRIPKRAPCLLSS